jgi:hypothetical protein
MAEQVTWRNPPGNGKGRRGPGYKYEAEAAQCRSKPGEWMVLKEFPLSGEMNARNMRSQLNAGRYHVFRPADEFEAVSAKEVNDSGATVVNVYVRYTGNSS